MSARNYILAIMLSTFGLIGTAHAVDIVVTSTLDFAEVDSASGREDSYTCTYTDGGGAIFKAAPNGVCTLRRAVLEAGVRPDADRPINILFDIPDTDPNYDAVLDLWEVQIDSSFIWEIDRRFISDDGGQVTIDGDSQPTGRNNGPRIMINTNSENSPIFGRSLQIRTSNNIVQGLGFHGGGQIILYEANNIVQDVWMGLTNDGTGLKLASDASSQARRSMARGGISMPNEKSDNNIIRDNIIIGASERAISVTSGGDDNQISNNFIGTDANGVVPITGTIDCTRNLDYNPALWYGGRGIRVTGTGNKIVDNTIAGLHSTQSTNDTPPITMEIAGINNSITNNTIGRDGSNAGVGVCGQGMLIQGTEGMVTDNTLFFTRNGFDPGDVGSEFDAAIIMQSFTGQGGGDPDRWMQVWNNTIDGGNFAEANFHAYRFAGPGVPLQMRQFIPAKVTSINGTTVSGTNGDPLPLGPSTDCPNCTIYLYADDSDDRIESFELLGTATANASGNWTTTISRPLAGSEGIRTQSESNAPDVMHIYDAQTTTRLSDDLYSVPKVISVKDGYIQLDTIPTDPPPSHCNNSTHRGRMVVDDLDDLFYICTQSGWTSLTLIGAPASSTAQNDTIAALVALDTPVISVKDGYIQLDTIPTDPPPSHCNDSTHRGRMVVDDLNDLFYICTQSGWTSLTLIGAPASSTAQNDTIAALVPLDTPVISVKDGYIQLDTIPTDPPPSHCNDSTHRGRMVLDDLNDLFYICTQSGWTVP